MKYIVTVWIEAYEVEAESEDEAKELAAKDDCVSIEDSFKFSHVQIFSRTKQRYVGCPAG